MLTFLVGDLKSTISWSLLGQHVILYVEMLNEKSNRLILCPNHEVECDIITKMRTISCLNINIMSKYRSARAGEDIVSDQNLAIKHFVNNTLSFVGLELKFLLRLWYRLTVQSYQCTAKVHYHVDW